MSRIEMYKKYDDCIKVVMQVEDKFVFQVYDIANIDDVAWIIIEKEFDNKADAAAEFALEPPRTGWAIQAEFE